MEKLSILAFHPVKMQSCYQKVEELKLEGLQQRFDVHGPSVFVSRAQILMREVRCRHTGVLVHNTVKERVCQSAAWFLLRKYTDACWTKQVRHSVKTDV